MIDFARLLALVDDMPAPNLPNLPKDELGRPESRNDKAAPNLPNLPNQKTGWNVESCELGNVEVCPSEEHLFSYYLQNHLGRLGKLGASRAANGYSRPSSHHDKLGTPEKLGALPDSEEDWACPLGHRAFWISAAGLKICSTCHPKPQSRRTP